MRKSSLRWELLVICFLTITSLAIGQSATISGRVTDAATGDPLPGANVYLAGTAIGASSDLKGNYQIMRVPPGSFTLTVTFIGYKSKEMAIQVGPGEKKTINLQLEFDVVEGETVVITAQAEGQVAAINQQLRSNTIKNVVSAERIMELPDANAAESVGRLPGISIKRSGGEGNRVVIRGLAPTYNSITIGGERIPATDLNDRSVDLNMISPEMLAGIEVTKALTPDQDADAFGGTVNFMLADAPTGGFRSNIRFQSGYNNQRNELGQYKGSVTLSNRYWGEKFGLLVTGNIERAQRGSDTFEAEYQLAREKREGELTAPITVSDVNLRYIEEIRKRLGYSVLMDYRLPNGKLMFSNFMSRLDRDQTTNQNKYSEDSNWHELRFWYREQQIDILTNSLSGEHNLPLGTIDWRMSRTASSTRHPYEGQIRFKERSAFDRSELPEAYGPHQLVDAAFHNLDNNSLYNGNLYTEKSYERDYNLQMNVKVPYTFGSKIAGYLKFGGKMVQKRKERDRSERGHRLDNTNPQYERHHTKYRTPGFEYLRLPTGWPSVHNYIDPDFYAEDFLGGEYVYGPGLDKNELLNLLDTYLIDSLFVFNSLAELDDYEATEKVSAGYMMTEINLGRFLMFLPGVRYERTDANMTGRKGFVPDGDEEPRLDESFIADTTASASYDRWFPMYHLRFRPSSWFDVRLAYTKTLSRPRLDWMMPKKRVDGSGKTVTFGHPFLQPQVSTNYDAFLSFYGNRIGLFTVGGFYKEIENLIFSRDGHKILNAVQEGYPSELQGYTVNKPENNAFLTKVKGWEVEWQTNFTWLPSPLDGIVLNANYTHIWSETHFPRSLVLQERIPVFPFIITSVVDTFRVGSMPDQADDIANVAIGYDKGPFSARLSMLYQGKTLTRVGERPELDGFTDDLLRMDLSVRYRLTRQIGIFFNWNNILNEPDQSFQQTSRYPTDIEYYGWTTDLGIGYVF